MNKGEINVTEHEPKTVTTEKKSSIWFETVKESKDVTTTVKTIRCEVEVSSTESPEGEPLPEVKHETSAELHSEKAAVKTRVDVQEIITERQQDAAQSDSTQPSAAASTAVQPLEQKTESVEISSSKQDQVKPSQTSTLKHEGKTVTTEKELRIESIVQFETVKESKDVTTTDVKPEQSTDKIIRFEVEVSSTESPEGEPLPEVKKEIPKILKTTEERLKEVKDPGAEENVQMLKQEMQESHKSQETESVNKGEINVTEHESKTVTTEKESRIESIVQSETVESKDMPTTVKTIRFEVEVSSTESPEGEPLPEVKQEIPKILKTTSLKKVKHPGVQEKKVQVLKQEMQETPKIQETESVNKGEIDVTEHEPKTVTTEKESRIESIAQSKTVKESKVVTTTVKTIRFEVEVSSTESPEGEPLPEVKDETSADIHSEKAAVKTRVDVQEIITERQQDAAQSDSTQPSSAASTAVQPLEQKTESVEISSSKQDQVKPSQTSTLEHEAKTVTTEKELRIESIVQRERVKESKDVTTTDVQPDQSLVKTIRFEVEVSSTESPEGEPLPEIKQEIPKILQTTSLKKVKHPGVQEKKVQVLKQEMQESPKSQDTESVNKGEIDVTEHEPKTVTTEKDSSIWFETVKESKDVTTTVKTIRFEVDVSSTESPEGEPFPEGKDETSADIHSEKAAVKTRVDVQEIITERQQDEAQSDSTQPSSAASTAVQPLEQKTESVEISSSKQDQVKPSQTSTLEHEAKTVTTEKELRIESIVQRERVKQSKDVTTTDVQPDQSTDKMIRCEVEVSSTESPEGEPLPEVKQEIPKILKTTSLKGVKHPGVQEKKVQELKREMQEAPKRQETEYVNKGEINVTEHEPKTVTTEKESRIESIVQSETVESKDVPTTVKTIRFEVEMSSTESPEGEPLPEVKQEIPKILKTAEERLKEVKDPGAEENVQMLKQEIQETPKSQETESVNKGEINVTEREPKTVTTEKESSIWFDTFEESKDVTTTAVQSDPSPVERIRFEVEESSTESPSGLSVDPRVQTDKHTTDPTEKKEEEQEEKRLIQKQQSETIVKAEKQNVPLPKSTAATTGEVWHHVLGLPKVRHEGR